MHYRILSTETTTAIKGPSTNVGSFYFIILSLFNYNAELGNPTIAGPPHDFQKTYVQFSSPILIFHLCFEVAAIKEVTNKQALIPLCFFWQDNINEISLHYFH